MSALTSIFNFLYVYFRFLFAFITGSKIWLNSFTDEQLIIVRSIMDDLGFSDFTTYFMINDGPEPIFMLVIGIFALGSIIGLVRRLVR